MEKKKGVGSPRNTCGENRQLIEEKECGWEGTMVQLRELAAIQEPEGPGEAIPTTPVLQPL